MIGVRLGIDVGRSRIGVARCDPLGMLAVPVETIARSLPVLKTAHIDTAAKSLGDHSQKETLENINSPDIQQILNIAAEYGAVDVVVGLPLNLKGEKTASTADAEYFAQILFAAIEQAQKQITVRLIDERLSTVTASASLRQAGKNSKKARSVIDQAAAVVILQHALDLDKNAAAPVGKVVS